MDGTRTLRLASCFGDHMVLQADKPVLIWGWGSPGSAVSVRFRSVTQRGRADAAGRWQVQLEPVAASADPSELVLADDDGSVICRDVVVGEVWLCSGQSNMFARLAESLDGASIAAATDEPDIRLITIPRTKSATPLSDCPGEAWRRLDASSAPTASAVAYYFGCALRRRLGLPVGLVVSAWGGSALEPWVSPATIARNPVFHPVSRAYETLDEPAAAEPALSDWSAKIEQWRKVNAAHLPRAEFDQHGRDQPTLPPPDAGWEPTQAPFVKDACSQIRASGVVWYRREVALPESWRGRQLTLALGQIDGEDVTLCNGQEVGRTDQRTPKFWLRERRYGVPANCTRTDRLTIDIRVRYLFAGGNAYGRSEPMALIGPDGARLPIEAGWAMAIEKTLHPVASGRTTPLPWPIPRVPWDFGRPGRIFNGMIHPLVPLAVRGVLWYQGESNVGRASVYAAMLRALIADWRERWNEPTLPFGIVQLAGFGRRGGPPADSAAAELRDAQREVADTVTRLGLATAVDVGEPTNVHPPNKQPVGERLARWALAEVYGQPVAWRGPTYRSHTIASDGLRVCFDHVGEGLRTTDGQPPRGFAVAAPDTPFAWVQAQIAGAESVLLSPSPTGGPVELRYAWADFLDLNLTDGDGLPARPFRTDERPWVTAGCEI